MAAPAQIDLESQLWLWISKNKKESSRLEFKLRVDLSTPGAKAEFIKDVIALANSEGEYPRADGHLVIGFKNGERRDVANDHYDGATFSQILDSYVFPPVNIRYEELDDGSAHRVGVLIIKPDANALYVVNKKLQDAKGQTLLQPGQSWGRKADRKLDLSGEAIHERISQIMMRGIEESTFALKERIVKLEQEGGIALEVKRIRFEMEATRKWSELEALLGKLLPYAREFDHQIKHEVLSAARTVTAWGPYGMTLSGAYAIDAVLGEVMPVGTGGMHHPSREEISAEDQSLLKHVEQLAFELLWDACRYIRDPAIVRVMAGRYRQLIRITALNGLEHLQKPFLENARYCQEICNEGGSHASFSEGWQLVEEAINNGLNIA